MTDPNRPTLTDEDMQKLLAPIVQAIGAYGRAESERMGGTVTIAAYMVIESRVKEAITAAYARGLQRAAEIALEHGRCYCHELNLPLHDKGCIVSVARLLDREREGQSEENR